MTSLDGQIKAERLLDRAAARGEGVVSSVRMFFAAVLLLRLPLTPYHPRRTLPDAAVLLVVLCFSAWVLHRCRQGRIPSRLLYASIVVDAASAFLALLPGALWPWPPAVGLVHTPDLSALLLVAMASGFRLSVRSAVIGTGASVLAAGALFSIEWAVGTRDVPHLAQDVPLFLVLLLIAGAAGIAFAARTRSLVRRASSEATRAGRTESTLRSVLIEHHDVRSALAAAVLDSEALEDSLSDADAHRIENVRQLRANLQRMRQAIERVKSEASAELYASETARPADIRDSAEEAVRVARQHFPKVSFELKVGRSLECCRALGGSEGLSRALLRLLVNACEGDGARGASRIVIHARHQRAENRVLMTVEDDGPGFSPAMRPGWLRGTTKETGTGVGLLLVRDWIESGGGRVTFENGDEGGARVRLELSGLA